MSIKFYKIAFVGLIPLILISCIEQGMDQGKPPLVARNEQGFTNSSYGYQDLKLSDTYYQISYQTPLLSTNDAMFGYQSKVDQERQRAIDFALWRTAQLSLEKGYPYFLVENQTTDAKTVVEREVYYRPIGPGYPASMMWSRSRVPPFYRGWPYHDPWREDYNQRTRVQILVQFNAKLLKTSEVNSMDAKNTIEKMQQLYGLFSYPAR
ncbi:MAG: hypothetical protein K1X44_02410 [Alphaproteobacteria bacterium]|nr:hypothetical protein [Alphaproteobacteria bacterium]